MTTQTSSSGIQEREVDALSHPKLAAFRLGRRINEIQHRIELAWLTYSSAEDARIQELWHEVRLLARGLTGDEQQREILTTLLRDADEYWCSQFGASWHAELCFEMERDLMIAEQGRTTLAGCHTLNEVLHMALDSISPVAWELKDSLIVAIPPELIEMVSFGNAVDQLLHIPNPHRDLTVVEADSRAVQFSWDLASSRHSVPQDETKVELFLPAQEPRTELLEELRLRWRQLGFPASDLENAITDSPVEIVGRIEQALYEQVGNPVEQCHVRSGYLGLAIDGVELRRDGFGSVEIHSRLPLMLAQRLIDNGRRPTTYEELEDDWEELGGRNPRPKQGTIRIEIGRLRREIRPLDVCIPRGRPGIGWRFESNNTT